MMSWKYFLMGIGGLLFGIAGGLLVYRASWEWIIFTDDATPRVLFIVPQAWTWQSAPSSTTEPVTPPKVAEEQSILFVGDIMLDRDVRLRMNAAKDPFYPFLLLKNERGEFFRGQDAVVVNLEGPVTASKRPPEKEIDFAFDPSVVKVLKDIGVTAVSQANNHALDQGRAGADESLALLRAGGLIAFGDQVRDAATSSLGFITVKGKKIALLGWNITDNPLDQTEADAAVALARSQAHKVIVFMHWGAEYSAKPNGTQTKLARHLIDIGVDTVIGAHPHWMQTVEVYHDKLILYSLGNFVFDQDWSTETGYGLAAKVVFGETASRVELYPVQIVRNQPKFLEGDARAKRLDALAEISDPALASSIRSGTLWFK